MRRFLCLALSLIVAGRPLVAQVQETARPDKTFLTRGDLLIAGAALAGTALLSRFDPQIARSSQQSRYQDSSSHRLALRISKVNETTLTAAGIIAYGIGRATHSDLVSDVALHATESVVLASLASQLIRGPLGRSRPYVTRDSNQYDFSPGAGFKKGDAGFDHRAFPSIHTSSSMAIATVIVMEMKRRGSSATPFVAPVLFAAGLLPGLARIQLDQHWASDVAAGAFMGVFTGYKVVSYSHDHPGNWFDRTLLPAVAANISPMNGGLAVTLPSPF